MTCHLDNFGRWWIDLGTKIPNMFRARNVCGNFGPAQNMASRLDETQHFASRRDEMAGCSSSSSSYFGWCPEGPAFNASPPVQGQGLHGDCGFQGFQTIQGVRAVYTGCGPLCPCPLPWPLAPIKHCFELSSIAPNCPALPRIVKHCLRMLGNAQKKLF